MKTFIVLLILVFFGTAYAGYAYERPRVRPGFEDETIRNAIQLSDRDAGGRRYFAYICNGKVLAERPLDSDLQIDLAPIPPNDDRGLIVPTLKDYKTYVSALFGSGVVLKYHKAAIGALEDSSTPKARKVLAFVVAGLSGAIVGYEYAQVGHPRCDSPVLLRRLRYSKTWQPAIDEIELKVAVSALVYQHKSPRDADPVIRRYIVDYKRHELTSKDVNDLVAVTKARTNQTVDPNVDRRDPIMLIALFAALAAILITGLVATARGALFVGEVVLGVARRKQSAKADGASTAATPPAPVRRNSRRSNDNA